MQVPPTQSSGREIVSYSEEMLVLSGMLNDPDSLATSEKLPELKVAKLITFAAYQTLIKSNDA
jgi:hypothetical protein